MAYEQIIVALVVGLGGWTLGALTAQLRYEQKAEEILFGALGWLGGRSQRRNIGISAVELYLSNPSRIRRLSRSRFRDLGISALTGSAIYLISSSKQKDKAIEVYKLDRIMDLLLKHRIAGQHVLHYGNLQNALSKALDEIRKQGTHEREPGLWIEKDSLRTWLSKLQGSG